MGALAHPLRRRIVERLAVGPETVGRVTSGFSVSKPTISRHLKVLESAGVVVRTVEGRHHRLQLDGDVLNETAQWLNRQTQIWERLFDAVDEHLLSGQADDEAAPI